MTGPDGKQYEVATIGLKALPMWLATIDARKVKEPFREKLKFRAGQKPVAWFAGGSGIAQLFLFVWHCSEAIALLTGSLVALALLLALAIDCGLVACEVALISEPRG